jgi:hypothetical protein
MKKSESLKIKIYISLLIIVLPVYAISQDSVYKFSPHWYINSNVGVSYSQGDIAKYIDFPKWPDFNYISPGADLVIGRQLFPSIGISAGLYYGRLTGMSENGNHFESDLFDYKLSTTVNFNSLFGFCAQCRLNIHGSAGIGQTQYKTKVYDERGTTLYGYDQSLGELRGNGMEGRRVAMIFPLSLGLDYKLSTKVQLYVDYTVKFANSDLIDGKITGDNNDVYNFTSIGLRYNFRKKKKDVSEAITEDKLEDQIELEPKHDTSLITNLSPALVDQLSDALIEKLKPLIKAEINQKPVIEDKQVVEVKQIIKAEIKPKPVIEDKQVIEVKQIIEEQSPTSSVKEIVSKPLIEYCVQIRASFKQPLSISDLSNDYNLEQSKIVYKGIHNNWHLYAVGSFATFKEANQERIKLKEKHGIKGAFVILFENGKRVVE